MKALERKALQDVADELIEEDREVGADFYDRISQKLRKYRYDPTNEEERNQLIDAFFNRR